MSFCGRAPLATSASLGLPADFFEPYYSPHMPKTVSLRLAHYPPPPVARGTIIVGDALRRAH